MQRLLVHYLARYRRRFLLGATFTLLATALGLLTPWLLRQAIDSFSGVATALAWPLHWYALAIVAVAVLEAGARFTHRMLSTGASRQIEYDLRNRFFAHLETLEPAYFQSHRTGDLVARATNDLSAARQLFGPAFSNLVNTTFTLTLTLALIYQISLTLALWATVVLPSAMVVLVIFRTRLAQRFTRVQEQFGALADHAQETFAGERVVKAYAQEQAEVEAFRQISQEYVRRQMDQTRLTGLVWPSMSLVIGLLTVLLLYVGGRQVLTGEITLGEFVQVSAYLGMLAWPVMALGWVATLWQQGSASLTRIHEVLSREPTVVSGQWSVGSAQGNVSKAVGTSLTGDGASSQPSRSSRQTASTDEAGVVAGAVAPIGHAAPSDTPSVPSVLPSARGSIEFRGVSLTLDGMDILKEINLTIPAGATYAFVGALGSGKSSLVALVPRLYDVTAGQVLVDGVDVRDYPLEALRQRIGYVPQETFLFSDSLRENVAFGVDPREATASRIHDAVRLSRLENDLDQWPEGLDTVIGERGVTLSGGQKQRTSIARAVARDPDILILDDALSSVDTRTEEAILQGLRAFMERRTSLLVAHRVSTVRLADCIVVLEGGRIVEQGVHADLVRRSGLYARMYRRQLIASELGVEDEEETSEQRPEEASVQERSTWAGRSRSQRASWEGG